MNPFTTNNNFIPPPAFAMHPDPVAAALMGSQLPYVPAVQPIPAAAAAVPAAAAAAPHLMTSSLPYASAAQPFAYNDDDSDEGGMPWDNPNWVPLEKSGKQKTPNRIRGELQRYIDACKADGSMTQTGIIDKMGVNSNTFRRFMNPKTYKDQWSATQNGTYWGAAKLLEEVKLQKELAKKSGAKRKSDPSEKGSNKKAKTSTEQPAKKSAAQVNLEALELLNRISAVEGVPNRPVYDSCPQLVKKMKAFLARPGMTKKNLCAALGDINNNSLGKFLAGKGQDQCGNVAYRQGWVFFEKLRILEGQSKSAARRKNEVEHPEGFDLEKARAGRYIKFLPPHPTFGW